MSTDGLVVHVAQLRRHSGAHRKEVRQVLVDPYERGAPPGPADSSIPPGRPVTCDLDLQSFPGGVMVTGTLQVPWQGTCRRCTAPVEGEVEVAVRERFAESEDISPDDDEAYPIVEDRVDLGPMIHEVVLLELPASPLCAQDCQGLCPWCGADRNQEACGCVAPRDPRWASLDVLRSVSAEEPAQPAPDRG